ncbi:NUDIX hydrolase [bacterium]|jgi:ADP-ribose pyrophosphatase|nr:NUDIX hydrolase [bacterium]MBT6293312.1 NUDIX hydrolase [bacterium]
MSKLPKFIERNTVYESKFIKVHRDKIRTHSDKTYKHHVLESPFDSVVSIIKNTNGQLAMVSSIRYVQGIEDSLELPAGGIDPNEEPMIAAKREFREETGFESHNLTFLGDFYPSNSMMTQKIYVFGGELNESMERQEYDKDEVSETFWYTLEQIKDLIRNKKITCGVTLSALTLYMLNN